MGETVTIQAADGHDLGAYVATPGTEPMAGLVVIQEIFGVNRHIRSVADSYAKDGFLAVAPALFDREERGVELSYDGDDAKKGMALRQKLEIPQMLADIDAAIAYAGATTGKKVGVIGYCLGGLLAWLSATRLQPAVAVGYYAGGIGNFATENPSVPVQLHFGRLDSHIPAAQVDGVQRAHPEAEIHWHEEAGHGFNCEMRSAYHPQSATLARARALQFLNRHLA